MLERFLTWFFNSPTPLITIVSATIAFLAYQYQRKLNKKRLACQIAEKYSKTIIPRIRYINSILKETGVQSDFSKITKFENFTSKDLKENLSKSDLTIEEVKNKFKTINRQMLIKAFLTSGCNSYICDYHKSLVNAFYQNSSQIDIAFYKFVLDFLNDIETIAIQFEYNIADEKLVYPILHQTFLKNMNNWYFFIADENQLDQDRYFTNIIALYIKWETRAKEEGDGVKKAVFKQNRAKKL